MAFAAFTAGFAFIFVSYIVFSFSLQRYFYFSRAGDVRSWKSQPLRYKSVGKNSRTIWLPLLGFFVKNWKVGQAPDHPLFATINIIVASTFAGAVATAIVNGATLLVFDLESSGGIFGALLVTAASIIWESILEYYWHRLMHLPWFYKRFHKAHHFYTSPEPFDDMYIHPVEAFGYYCILYSPPFVMPLHVGGFLVYMAIMGTLGILDHSGVIFFLPGVYDSADHDLHHSCFNINYGFPFPFLDILHGTYVQASLERGKKHEKLEQ